MGGLRVGVRAGRILVAVPTVGIVIPLHASGGTIDATLRSVRAQSLEDWRAVVVDDGSTDDGPQIASRHAREDGRIRVVRQGNRGLPSARNTGIEALEARYLMLLDADDLLFRDAAARLVRRAEETGLGAAYCGYEFLDGDGESIGRQTAAARDPVGLDELLEWNRFAAHSQLIRRDLLGDARFDESLTSGEDYDLWLRLGERGVAWSAEDGFLVGYRIRPDSMSKDFRRMARNEASILGRAFARVREGGPRDVDASVAREGRVRARSALAYTTRMALADGARDGDATALLGELAPGRRLSPGDVATASVFAIQYGSACDPWIVAREPARWVPRLDGWWRTLALSGFADVGTPGEFASAVLDAFASVAVHPRAVAEAALARAEAEGLPLCAPSASESRWVHRVASGRVPEDVPEVIVDASGGGQRECVRWENVRSSVVRAAREELRACWAARAGRGT